MSTWTFICHILIHMDTDFLENVNLELKKRKLTQNDLCKATGISINTYRGWVSKNVTPPVNLAYKIATYLSVSLDYLASGELTDTEYKEKYEDLRRRLEKTLKETEK